MSNFGPNTIKDMPQEDGNSNDVYNFEETVQTLMVQ